ncbi:hypothetical protein HETIRDRAFT_455690 [Heterobasidion irregulare TC 32-1]|uniref:Protein kinase domain-containing protein n=1 Tax=Heterobasidion irregulare (strain TC 32-1) TaxID=747525 RepID=W4JRC8_HETIT|nr:uncharacterized protein HETIRDRAFT_455690 [Heterobasidion irregulare TC 32-1]ETW76127.1 hypothetical protein HETIRDRAFT_455690 [Heterobasidion irregulare TC 32-1]
MVRGGLTMVVMDRIEGQNAFSRFGKSYPQDSDSPSEVEDLSFNKVKVDVKKAVDLLHSSNLVFGDLRRPNIMVVRRPGTGDSLEYDGGMLIDFDWAGPVGQTKYPSVINDSGEIDWAEGVKAGTLIEKHHDLDEVDTPAEARPRKRTALLLTAFVTTNSGDGVPFVRATRGSGFYEKGAREDGPQEQDRLSVG